MNLALKYTLFAALSTVANIGAQYFCLYLYRRKFSLYIAMFAGTAIGLVLKYLLDKKYIFYYEVVNKREDLGKFVLYSMMGVLTTFIFWCFEITFHALFNFPSAKFIGAVVGLSIGYISKYNLDKRFVFVKTRQ